MNAKTIIAIGFSTVSALTVMSSPPLVIIQPPTVVVPVPAPVVSVPAPAVTVDVAVPDSYVWDGYEYVGVVGDQYYYLGPDHVWLTFDAPRIARFHDWERVHADWREHAIHNDLYRRDAHGHDAPLRDLHAAPDVHLHDIDHGHDTDHHDQDRHDDHNGH